MDRRSGLSRKKRRPISRKTKLYNPNTLPASIELNLDRAVDWLQKGAQPSHTARNLLSEQGAMLKNHLINGLNKGALTEDDVNTKFEAWVKEKEGKNEVLKKKINADAEKARAAAINAEKDVSIKRKEAAAAQAKAQEEEAAAAENENAQTGDTATPEAPQAEAFDEQPAVEETPAEETPAEEATPAAEQQKEEAETDEPAAEAPAEEAIEEEATPATEQQKRRS